MWPVFITPAAQRMFQAIQDGRIREKLRWASLWDSGAFGPSEQRYRIIYKVEKSRVIVIVVAVGLSKEGAKKDIYALARKLLRLRLTE